MNSLFSAAFQLLSFVSQAGGNPHRAKQYFPDPNYDGLSSVFRDSMELFVLGHEYGHVISGHLEQDNIKKAVITMEEADEISTDWRQEFEADARGLELMLAVMMKKYDLSLSFAGADLFFGCIDVVERSVSLLREGTVRKTISTTHPPTQLRREMLRKLLKSSIPEERALAPIQISSNVQNILEYFWDFCEPVLQQAYMRNVRLAPMWSKG